MLILTGEITLVEPLSISMGGKEYGGFPMIPRYVEDGSLEPTGFLPATTLRGRLRRGYVKREMKAAAERGEHYSLKQAYSEVIGQNAESEKEAGEIDLVEVKETREASPILDLYGSGLVIASRLRVSNFFPENNVEPNKLQTFRKDLDVSDEILQSLSKEDQDRFYNRKDLNSRRSKWETNVEKLNRDIAAAKRKKEVTADLEAQKKEAEKKYNEVLTEMGDMMKVSSPLPVEWYALPPGLKLFGKIVVVNDKPMDLEILEAGLDDLSRDPVLGAASARGCGEIEGEFAVSIDGEHKKTIRFGGYKPIEVENL